MAGGTTASAGAAIVSEFFGDEVISAFIVPFNDYVTTTLKPTLDTIFTSQIDFWAGIAELAFISNILTDLKTEIDTYYSLFFEWFSGALVFPTTTTTNVFDSILGTTTTA